MHTRSLVSQQQREPEERLILVEEMPYVDTTHVASIHSLPCPHAPSILFLPLHRLLLLPVRNARLSTSLLRATKD